MGRYLKYLEIVNAIDAKVKEKTAGKVDIDKDLPKIKEMLEVQKLALEMSMAIDRIDDNVKSSFKLYKKGDPSARGVIEELVEKVENSNAANAMRGMAGFLPWYMRGEGNTMRSEGNTGRDFRDRSQNSIFDCGYSNRSGTSEGRSYGHYEEDRRRGRSELDSYKEGYRDAMDDEMNRRGRRGRSEQDFVLLPDRMQDNANNNTNGPQIQTPVLRNTVQARNALNTNKQGG